MPVDSWKPSPSTLPSASATTEPTCGLGEGSPFSPSAIARRISSWSTSLAMTSVGTRAHELAHFAHERVDVAERTIDAGEAYVRDLVERLESRHHTLAN